MHGINARPETTWEKPKRPGAGKVDIPDLSFGSVLCSDILEIFK